MSAELSLSYSHRPDGAPVLCVSGEIDRGNSAELDAAVTSVLDRAVGRLTVDLSHVAYLDSAGLSILFAHADQIEIVTPPLLAPVLAISGLGQVTPIRAAGGAADAQDGF